MRYPEILLPRQSYPILENDDVKDYVFVRETITDVYQFLAETGYEPEDILPLVVAPQPSLREVFELSVYLYGYYDERHTGIRVEDTALYSEWNNKLPELCVDDIKFSQENVHLLFLAAIKLDRQEIDFNGKPYLFSFSHKPTRVNYWHFELWVKDSSANHIPRDKSNAHTRYLAKSILEYIIAEAVIYKNSVNIFNRIDFE